MIRSERSEFTTTTLILFRFFGFTEAVYPSLYLTLYPRPTEASHPYEDRGGQIGSATQGRARAASIEGVIGRFLLVLAILGIEDLHSTT